MNERPKKYEGKTKETWLQDPRNQDPRNQVSRNMNARPKKHEIKAQENRNERPYEIKNQKLRP